MQTPMKYAAVGFLLTGLIMTGAPAGYSALTWKSGKKKVQEESKRQASSFTTLKPASSKSASPAIKRPVIDKKAVAAIAANRPGKKVAKPALAAQSSKVDSAPEKKQRANAVSDKELLSPVAKALIASENVNRVQQQLEKIFKVSEQVRQASGANTLRVQSMVDQARKHQSILAKANLQVTSANQRSLASAQSVLQNSRARQIREQVKGAAPLLSADGQRPLGVVGQTSGAGTMKPTADTRRPG